MVRHTSMQMLITHTSADSICMTASFALAALVQYSTMMVPNFSQCVDFLSMVITLPCSCTGSARLQDVLFKLWYEPLRFTGKLEATGDVVALRGPVRLGGFWRAGLAGPYPPTSPLLESAVLPDDVA